MTPAQIKALTALCERYGSTFDERRFSPVFDLPAGWVAGWILDRQGEAALYVGCDPDGSISS